MKKRIFVISLMIILMIACIVPSVKAATAKNVIDEETVKKMVEESTTQAVNDALANSETTTEVIESSNEKDYKGIGLIAAAISTGLGCLAAGISVAVVGSSAIGAVSENPKLLGKTIIIAGLAEGIAIYGLIISIMILNKI